MPNYSIIIPLAPDETQWEQLAASLKHIPPAETEIIFVGSGHYTVNKSFLSSFTVHWLTTSPGRGHQMNLGAKHATGTFLWFLHADSSFDKHALRLFDHARDRHAHSLLYFDLKFKDKPSILLRLNEWGARFRSNCLTLPFGDQGFCINKKAFESLGGFPESLAYGEDHMFVWKARQHGLSVKAIGAPLHTSARKYQKNGWLRTTVTHHYLWIKQAWPEIKRRCKLCGITPFTLTKKPESKPCQ